MSETLSSGLTLVIPSEQATDWSDSIRDDCFQKISEHDHTGAGKGVQMGTNAIADGAVTAGKLAPGLLAVPVGIVLPYVGTSAPGGYSLCDGGEINRTTFSALFAIIGTAYGAGDGSTTFNKPDLRQRFPLGRAVSGTGNVLGGVGGNIDHNHTTPAHAHTVNSHNHTVPAHFHGMGAGADLNIVASGSHNHANFSRPDDSTSSGSYFLSSEQTTQGVQGIDTEAATHLHTSANFAGSIGLVTGGVNGNAVMTSGNASPGTDTSGAGTSGNANAPFQTFNYIIKT